MRVWARLKTWADEEAQSARIYRRLRETALEHQDKRVGFWSLLFWAYNVRAWTGKRQGTLGMRWVGIFITDLKGQPLGRWRATGRFFARFLSYYTGYGFWLQNVNGRRQTLHDRISGSVVLRRPAKKAATPPDSR